MPDREDPLSVDAIVVDGERDRSDDDGLVIEIRGPRRIGGRLAAIIPIVRVAVEMGDRETVLVGYLVEVRAGAPPE
jgi:hypothetical protein